MRNPYCRVPLAVLLYTIAAAQVRQAEILKLHNPLKRELNPGQTDSLAFDAAAGQFAGVVVRKQGLDVVLTILDPAGNVLVSANSPNRFGPEPAAFLTQAVRKYQVRVANVSRNQTPAKYEIELKDLHAPTETDKTEIQAQTKFYAAGAKFQAGGRENRIAAIDLYREAGLLWQGLGDAFAQAVCLNRIGISFAALGDTEKGLDFYRQAVQLLRDAKDFAGEAETLRAIGNIYYFKSDTQKALEYYLQSLPLNRAAGDRAGEGESLHRVALMYYAGGDLQKALDYDQQALPSRRAAGDLAGEALTLFNMGLVYEGLGERQKALDCFRQTLPLRRSSGDRSGEASTLNALGAMYRQLGEPRQALDFFEQALPIQRSIGERTLEANTLYNIGLVSSDLGDKKKALDFYQQALAIHRSLKNPLGEATSLSNLGEVYADLGELRKALGYYTQAISLARDSKEFWPPNLLNRPTVEADSLSDMGMAYLGLGDLQKALDSLNEGCAIYAAIGLHSGEATALNRLARVEAARGNLENADKLAARSLDIIESLRTKVVSQELRASYFATVQDFYGLETDVLMKLHRAADAVRSSERARARVLLDTLGEARADIREGVDPALLERESRLQSQLNAKEMERTQTLSGKHTPQQAADAEKSVTALSQQYEDVRARIREQSPHYASLNFPQPLSLQEIQTEVLDPGTLLLEYALGNERSYLWVVSSTGIESVELPERSQVEEMARTYYKSISAQDGPDSPESGKLLSRVLLGNAASYLGDKRLLIVPDGALQYLPFAALPDPDGYQQPLVVKHEIVTAPSASTLAVLRRETGNRKPAPKTLAVLADPVFSSDDTRVSRVHQESSPRAGLHTDEMLEHAARDIGMSGSRIPRLPGTRREAAAIISLVPETQRKQWLDFDASRANVVGPEIGQYRIVHFATHGLLNSVRPDLSGVILSLVNRQGALQDGFLRLHEIYNMKVSADLVVLSACQTGLGKDIHGEGLVGLTRGFMYAGAPSVMASLWKVDDRATAELMKQFYSGMLGQEALRPAAALRAAQVAMWKTKRFEAPYYWAAFTLQGEWH